MYVTMTNPNLPSAITKQDSRIESAMNIATSTPFGGIDRLSTAVEFELAKDNLGERSTDPGVQRQRAIVRRVGHGAMTLTGAIVSYKLLGDVFQAPPSPISYAWERVGDIYDLARPSTDANGVTTEGDGSKAAWKAALTVVDAPWEAAKRVALGWQTAPALVAASAYAVTNGDRSPVAAHTEPVIDPATGVQELDGAGTPVFRDIPESDNRWSVREGLVQRGIDTSRVIRIGHHARKLTNLQGGRLERNTARRKAAAERHTVTANAWSSRAGDRNRSNRQNYVNLRNFNREHRKATKSKIAADKMERRLVNKAGPKEARHRAKIEKLEKLRGRG